MDNPIKYNRPLVSQVASIYATVTCAPEFMEWRKNALRSAEAEGIDYSSHQLLISSARELSSALCELTKPALERHFVAMGLPGEFTVDVVPIRSSFGSWIVEAAVLIGALASGYSVVKALSQVPSILDGLEELSNRLLRLFARKANRICQEHLEPASQLLGLPTPPETLVTADLRIEPVTQPGRVYGQPNTGGTPTRHDLASEILMKALEECGVDDPNVLLFNAIFSGDTEKAKSALEDGANPELGHIAVLNKHLGTVLRDAKSKLGESLVGEVLLWLLREGDSSPTTG